VRRLDPTIAVTLVETDARYITCPLSNTVLAGMRGLGALTQTYERLREEHGVTVVQGTVTGIDASARKVALRDGGSLSYDRLVVAPGIAFRWGSPKGYDKAASEVMPHAWKAGPQTTLLARQVHAMQDGGVIGIAVPRAPFRCPPGPFERASLLAYYLKKTNKGRSKILILDANEKFPKQALFMEGWKKLYPGMIDWVPVTDDGEVVRVDPKTMTLYTNLDQHKVAVANVIPAQDAGIIAQASGLTDDTGWCPVNQKTFESTLLPKVHVLGDSSRAGAMPKSASAANSQARICALAVVSYLHDEQPVEPSYHNTCYSLLDPHYGISINEMFDLENGQITRTKNAGGTSPLKASSAFRRKEAEYDEGWYASITEDAFG